MNKYLVRITFDHSVIYLEDVTARTKAEAYKKAKARLAKRLFKPSSLKNYSCTEL